MSEFQQAVPAKSNGSAATETSAPTPGKQSLVDEVKPGAELFIDAKGKFLDVPIDGTPFKVEAEIGAEAKLKIEKAPKLDDPSSGRTKVTQSYGVEVEKKKDGPGIGIKPVAKRKVEHSIDQVLGFNIVGVHEQKSSTDGIELSVGVEANRKLCGVPMKVKASTGGAAGKKNELKLISLEGSVDIPLAAWNFPHVEVEGVAGRIDVTGVKLKGALKIDEEQFIRFLAQKGIFSPIIGTIGTGLLMIGPPVIFAGLAINAFRDMENFDGPVDQIALQSAVACKRLPAFLDNQRPANAIEQAFVDQLFKYIIAASNQAGINPHLVLRHLKHHAEAQQQLRESAVTSCRRAAHAMGRKKADEYIASKWVNIFPASYYYNKVDRIMERRFGQIDGASA